MGTRKLARLFVAVAVAATAVFTSAVPHASAASGSWRDCALWVNTPQLKFTLRDDGSYVTRAYIAGSTRCDQNHTVRIRVRFRLDVPYDLDRTIFSCSDPSDGTTRSDDLFRCAKSHRCEKPISQDYYQRYHADIRIYDREGNRLASVTSPDVVWAWKCI